MSPVCSACRGKIAQDDSLACYQCKERYHYACVGIATQQPSAGLKNRWVCPKCKSKEPKQGNLGTPVRPIGDGQISQGDSANVTMRNKNRNTTLDSNISPQTEKNCKCSCSDINTLREIIKSEIRSTINECLEEIIASKVTPKLHNIREEITCFRESMDFINAKFEEFNRDYVLHKEAVESMIKENESLRSTVQILTYRVNQMEQHSRVNNIEIQCVPEHKTENLITLVTQLGQTIGYPIHENDVAYCTRTAKVDTNSPRSRSILIKFISPRVRDSVLAAVVQYNKKHKDDKLNTAHLGMGGKKSAVYVIENLSPENKQLHAATRKRAKELNYRFVWVRNGRIYVRKTESSEAVLIRDMDTISKLH